MATVRRSTVVWEGDLKRGHGQVTAETSHAYTNLPVTWASRTENADGRTSPEELLASAHATCFSMAFSSALAKAGTPPQRLQVESAVTFDTSNGPKVTSSALTVHGAVPGMSQEQFQKAAEDAKNNCPISKALQGNVDLSVNATLENNG